MPSLASPARSICGLDALVCECGFGWTLPKQGKLCQSHLPSGMEWLDARLGGCLFRGCCESMTRERSLSGEHD